MTRRWLFPLPLAALIVVMIVVRGFPSSTHIAAVPAPRAQPVTTAPLIFQDDFNGPAGAPADPRKWGDWSTCTYNGTASVGKIRCGVQETLDGAGHLAIRAEPTYGAALSTAGRFGFQYGTMSAWIKVPSQPGYWPAFWSLNNRPSGRDKLPVGEVDAMEVYTTWRASYHVTVHHWNDEATWDSPDWQCANVDLSQGFHKYTASIQPHRISFFFDDAPCGDIVTKADGGGRPWAFGPDVTRRNWMLLSLAVGGANGQQAAPRAPAVMFVDRVEVRGTY